MGHLAGLEHSGSKVQMPHLLVWHDFATFFQFTVPAKKCLPLQGKTKSMQFKNLKADQSDHSATLCHSFIALPDIGIQDKLSVQYGISSFISCYFATFGFRALAHKTNLKPRSLESRLLRIKACSCI
jgi:hypothetical protein